MSQQLFSSQRLFSSQTSVKHGLSAWFQRIGRRKLRVPASDWNDPQTLPRLTQIQQEKSQALDLDTAMDRIVKLARKEFNADGTGIWLFTDNEIFFGAGTGKASNDERLRLVLLSTLLTSWQLSEGSLTQVSQSEISGGGVGSWLVEPVYQGHNVAGVLAAFSSRLNAFAPLDSNKIHFFADVLGQALTKAASEGLAESIGLEPAQLLQLVERMIPSLRNMVGTDEPWIDVIGAAEGIDTDDRYATALNAESSQALNPSVETLSATEDATSLSSGPPPRTLEVPAIGEDHESNAATANQAVSDRETVERSNFDRMIRPLWDRAVTSAKNYTRRAFSFVGGARAWNRDWSGLESQFGLRALIGTVAGLALVAIIFWGLKVGSHRHAQAVGFSPVTSAPEKRAQGADDTPTYREAPQSDRTGTVINPQPQVTEQARASAAMQVSHMQVTDQTARSTLRSLSQYELVGLRRRALYGDNSAAFLMGMAFEIGHGVRQDCKTAAQWVADAAAEGNAVAQFNLGLRYRDGDGVPANAEAAMKWLQKAADHQIPGAQVALTAVSSAQAQPVVSRP